MELGIMKRVGGLGIATVAIIVMYFGMLFSIGEMSAAMPHTGGAYSFCASGNGPWGRVHHRLRRNHRVRLHHRGRRLLFRRATRTP